MNPLSSRLYMQRKAIIGLWSGWALLVALTAGLFAWNAERERTEALDKAKISIQAAADVAAAHVERLFQSASFVVNLVTDDIGESPNWDAVGGSRDLWQKTRHWLAQSPAVPRIILTDDSGAIRLFSDQFPPPSISLVDRMYFAERRAAKDIAFAIGEPITGKVSRKVLIPLVRRLQQPNGAFAGIALANIEPETITRFFQSIDLGKHSNITLLRDDGTILVRHPDVPEAIGRKIDNRVQFPAVVQNRSHGSGFSISPIDNHAKIVAFRRVPEFRAVVLAGSAVDEVLAGWVRATTRTAVILGLAVLALTMLLWQLMRHYVEMKAKESLLQTRLRLSQVAIEGALDDLLSFALDAAEAQTASRIGFFHFVDADQENLTLQQWSTNTIKTMCAAEGKGRHYPISQAGVWADCVATRKPVIHNDYASLPNKRGMPEGHAVVIRELVVPILRNDQVVAIMGVGNKDTGYDDDDIAVVAEIASMTIDLALRMRIEAEERQLNKRLKATIDELSNANRELTRFAQVASHDLQEPIRSLVSYSQLIERRLETNIDPEVKEYLNIVVGDAKRMRDLVMDLLSYARLTDGRESFAPLTLDRPIATAKQNLAAAIAESGAVIEIGNMPRVSVDEGQMVQLFQNLIGNAIKFRRPNVTPLVRIDAVAEGEQWIVSVRDNGIGIEPRHHDQIFVIFQRLHNRQAYPGTGIGLAICKRIIETHGGRIWVESAGQDLGSIFRFTLPMAL